VADVPVTFTAPASGPSGTFASERTVTVFTNANGIATAPAFTANTQAGGYQVTVVTQNVPTPDFIHLTNLAGPAARLTVASGNGQSAAAHTAFALPLEVTVTDAFGNAVSNAQVTFAIQPNAAPGATGSFSGAAKVTQTSNKSGLAIAPLLTATGKPGSFTVIASIAGGAGDTVFDLNVVL
jgi:adhesin/invasin